MTASSRRPKQVDTRLPLTVLVEPALRDQLEAARREFAERTGVQTSLTRIAAQALERGLSMGATD